MYKISSHNKSKSIRFRRWSRKGYAVFCSLSKNVTIGRVCVSICDLSLKKSSQTSSNKVINTISKKEIDEYEDELSDFIESQFDVQLLALFNIANQKLSITGSSFKTLNNYHLFNNPAVDIRNTYINRIFYIKL